MNSAGHTFTPLFRGGAILLSLCQQAGLSGFLFIFFALGTLFPRLGDLQLQMGLSQGELGLSLVGAPLGVQLSLLVANHVVARFSLAKVITGLAVIMVFMWPRRLLAHRLCFLRYCLLWVCLSAFLKWR